MSLQRSFDDTPAKRERIGYPIGFIGPSGGGKTCSALRVATGARRVLGGEIFFIDTQGTQASQYAPAEGEPARPPMTFDFRRVPMGPPYSPADMMAAMKHCIDRGARVVIVDSMSDEHEGEGGVLEMQDEEWAKKDRQDKHKFSSWIRPKRERNRLVSFIRAQRVLFLLCYRAKESLKIEPGKNPEKLGWSWIGGDEYAYEMPLRFLLLPGAEGKPTLISTYPGEKLAMRTPIQFRQLIEGHKGPIDEALGEQLARWVAGETTATKTQAPAESPETKRDAVIAAIEMAPSLEAIAELKRRGGPKQYADEIRAAFEARTRELSDPENFDR